MRWTLVALMLIAGGANAQSSPPSAPSAGTDLNGAQSTAPLATTQANPKPARARHTMAERFDDANTTHDGHLTAEQARAKMPAVARDFAAIDTDNRGYVTLEEIQAYNRAKRAARRAAKLTAP